MLNKIGKLEPSFAIAWLGFPLFNILYMAGQDYQMKATSHQNCVFLHPKPPLPRLSPKIVGVREYLWYKINGFLKNKVKNE